jgi:hypothetical protein
MDSVTVADILADADEILVFDALVSTYARLERKMQALQSVMNRASSEIKPVAMQITDPFKQNGVAQVATVFELSDGQTVSIFFHNPDVNPRKIAPADELISWRWLLNKRDITLVVAPERGRDLEIKTVASRVMQLAAKNSPAFQRANVRRAERMQQIEDLKTEITALEKELAQAQSELEVAKQEYEERSLNPPNPPTLKKGDFQDYYRYRLNEIQNRFIAVKRALMAMGWLQGADGISLMDTLSSHAVVYQAKDTRIMKDGTWKLYKMGERGTWSPVKEFVDKRNNGYVETPREFARKIDKAAV